MELTIGFKAFDPHELLCHLAAVRLGHYRKAGIQVRLRDVTFLPDSQLDPDCVLVSCGAALLERLQGGSRKVVLAGVDRPLFWLIQRPSGGLSDLAGKVVSSFPWQAPPHLFLRLVLERMGWEGRTSLEPARDDLARLGLLRHSHVQAALISSAFPPPLLQRLGLETLLFLGDHLRVPTTGLAVSETFLRDQPQLVRTLIRIHQEALQALGTDPALAVAVLRSDFFPHLEEEACAGIWEWLRPGFTLQGCTPLQELAPDVQDLCRLIDSPCPDLESIYDFSWVE